MKDIVNIIKTLIINYAAFKIEQVKDIVHIIKTLITDHMALLKFYIL